MIALVTADLSGQPFDDLDRPALEASFGDRAQFVRWDAAGIDWAGYELVVLRSCWDYTDRRAEFAAWFAAVCTVARVLNPPAVVTWNQDKAYLGALAGCGVPVVPTGYAPDRSAFEAALAGLDCAEVVVKPTFSAGSDLTGRFERADPAAAGLAEQILARGKVVMVQPYQESVGTQGELAVIHLGGRFSHAVRKGPILGPAGSFLGGGYTEVIDPLEPPPDWLAAAERVLAGFTELAAADPALAAAEPLLYSRVDLIEGPAGQPLLLELELFEPSLFFPENPGAADRFTAATLARL